MIYIPSILTMLLTVAIFVILHYSQKSKIAFEIKIQSLEKTIIDLKNNLEIKNQRVKLSADLQQTMSDSKHILAAKIVDMNLAVFEELYPKK